MCRWVWMRVVGYGKLGWLGALVVTRGSTKGSHVLATSDTGLGSVVVLMLPSQQQ